MKRVADEMDQPGADPSSDERALAEKELDQHAADPADERALAEKELMDLLEKMLDEQEAPAVLSRWEDLLLQMKRGELPPATIPQVRDMVRMAENTRPKMRDEWKMTHHRMLVNTGAKSLYLRSTNEQGHEVLYHIDLGTNARTEIVRACSHFSDEEVQAVFLAIVKAKTGMCTNQDGVK